MSSEVKVPTLGESVSEATIGQWLKQPGDAVKLDEPIASLETDKVAVEVAAPAAGVMRADRDNRRQRRDSGQRTDCGTRRADCATGFEYSGAKTS